MRFPRAVYSFLSPIAASLSKAPTRSLFLIAVCLFMALSAKGQPNNCVPTRGEFQQKVDDLEKQKDAISAALRREAYTIFDSSYQGLNKATDATLGSLLMKSDDISAIQQDMAEAKAASKRASLATRDAALAHRSGQYKVEAAKMLEAAVAEAQAEWRFRKAFKTTAEIFARTPGDLGKPEDLAIRFWESRQDVADALRDLSLTGEAMERDEGLIVATGELKRQIGDIETQQRSAPYSRSASQQAACVPKTMKREDPSALPQKIQLTGQEYERERKKYVGAVEAASAAFSICTDRHQACVHSCDASRNPLACYQQCDECKDTAILKAQKELIDFDNANNFGYPKTGEQ